MQGKILKEAEYIKKDIPRLSKLNSEYVFSLVCYKYFYNGGELSHSDYINIFVDGKNDGGIDLIQVSEDNSNQSNLYLIQSKDIETVANYNDVIDILRKMHTTYNDFKNGFTGQYSKRLKEKFTEKLAEVEDVATVINLVVFLNSDISEERMETIEKKIDNEPFFEPYQISIFTRNNIEEQIESINSPKLYVEEAKIKISKEDKFIKYGENGLLVNIYASSIRDLYYKFRDKGLFEQNFRYFVKNKRIDDNIKDSLSKKRDKFWFLNNGMIIGCYDFQFDNEKVTAYKFSIINGCQTATLIGEYKGQNENEDFVIPCKFVKPDKNSTPEVFERFISEIAESSNSQKPISDRDLKSNKHEQRQLQRELRNHTPPIYLEIKRGESKKRSLQPWQYVINDGYGQLILSYFYQQPGTARNGKKKIFADEGIYSKIFKRKIDVNTVIDLLKLNQYYIDFLEKYIKQEQYTDVIQENVANNGRLIIIATIGFFIKYNRGVIDLKNIVKEDEWERELQKDNIKGKIFNQYDGDDFEDILNSLFLEIIQELADIYSRREDSYKTITNFFKVDRNYTKDILRHMKNRLIDIPTRKKLLDSYMQIFE